MVCHDRGFPPSLTHRKLANVVFQRCYGFRGFPSVTQEKLANVVCEGRWPTPVVRCISRCRTPRRTGGIDGFQRLELVPDDLQRMV